MNDFTKEELGDIAEMARHMRKQNIETCNDLAYQIEEKAKSMIDNYCEHEYEYIIGKTGFPTGSYCNKCRISR